MSISGRPFDFSALVAAGDLMLLRTRLSRQHGRGPARSPFHAPAILDFGASDASGGSNARTRIDHRKASTGLTRSQLGWEMASESCGKASTVGIFPTPTQCRNGV